MPVNLTNYPNGVTSFGQTVYGNGTLLPSQIPLTTSRYIYCSSVTGSNRSEERRVGKECRL